MCEKYLTDIPQAIEEHGICKTLAVRREVIHIKQVLTEVFIRKTVDIEKYLLKINMPLFDYMSTITGRLRKVHHFPRNYRQNLNKIVKADRDNFFPMMGLLDGIETIIVLDFDGVVTEKNFKKLYELCIDRKYVYICTANPTVTEEWFIKHEYRLPFKILACKGKIAKINTLIQLSKRHDYMFYVDNEVEYLEYAWLFGIQTYQYVNNKIKYFTLKTK